MATPHLRGPEAEQGDAHAQTSLGRCYADGPGVPQDQEEAVRLFLRAAKQGHIEAQFTLGLRYHIGRAVPQDEEEAARLYRSAAGQGYAHVQHNLGVCYTHEWGVPQDWEEVARLYRSAAEQGERRAQIALGVLLLDGAGDAVPWQPRQAALLLAQVAQQNDNKDLRASALEALVGGADERDFIHACCIGCGKSRKLKVCAKCHVAKFCGAECVRRVRPVHKAGCRRFAAEAAAAPAAD
jgi:TPR repeat protein